MLLIISAAKTCNDHEFICDGGACIPKRWLCDGEPDCPVGDDENKTLCGKYREYV